jgi:hypothetical protein
MCVKGAPSGVHRCADKCCSSPAGCAKDHYKVSEGKCDACLGGGSSNGGAVETCDCSSAGTGYNTGAAYSTATGCACASGYTKDGSNKCTRGRRTPSSSCCVALCGAVWRCAGRRCAASSPAAACLDISLQPA